MPIEKAIGEFRFAFGPDAQRTQMQPPPNCITLAHLSPELAGLFVAAFAPSGAQSGRPKGREWVSALGMLGRQLKDCPTNKAHSFFQGLSACPWCAIEVRAGILLFVGYAVADASTHFKLDLVWAQIASVQSPVPGTFPDFTQLSANIHATLQAKAAGWKRRGQMAAVILVAIAIVGICFALGLGAVTFWVGIGCFAAAKGLIDQTKHIKTGFVNEARATEARMRDLQKRWQREASDEPFTTKVWELKRLVEEHGQLPTRRQQMICDLERDLYNVQLRHFLERFDIASADIPHVKDNRKAMLSSYGIDDAADVTPTAVEAVPGFGQFLTGQIMAWRRALESKFRFDPKRGIDPFDVQRVDQDIAKRRMEIELILSRGQMELNEIRRRITIVRGQLQDQLQRAWMEMAQAQANARAA
jgi:DNA-binding helix-hairpin-helix protein with protein kinase domain